MNVDVEKLGNEVRCRDVINRAPTDVVLLEKWGRNDVLNRKLQAASNLLFIPITVATHKLIDTSCGIHQFLLAGIERMRSIWNFNLN